MLEWAAGKKDTARPFDGTIAGLVRAYQRDAASPYARVKWNTRKTYDQTLESIEKAVGARALAQLSLSDFRRWYEAAKKPRAKGSPERIRKAHGIISMIRRLVSYGVAAELPECRRLQEILSNTEFEQAPRRRAKLTYQHVKAFIPVALKHERLSLALGTALQFETTLRQRDVIGEWEPIEEGRPASGIVLNGRRWLNGLTWADISSSFEIYKNTTKTGQTAAHDLRLCPIVMDLLAKVPPARRVGPLIVDETAGRPYAEHAYAREWRAIADEAGIPRGIWNMDARAGGISEAEDAGADLDDIRAAAAHAQASTTVRYSRGAIGKSRKVARLRAAHRAERKPND
ncbi:MAG: integrase [Methylocystis sp.]|uniref:integrase n=1 Tax=Methylocystis sp. TaxID=1911079 RepID=UPI003DA49E23